MSFITKRERVFNEYDLFDLPARNEGKLKAYASCTDARAWSHFCSDKSEHLVEIIKRNNETCRPKYVPTEAIVNTLLANKHAEIARLKRKIEEFEQMIAAYDDLDLTCEQKCEIAKAHAAIKEANKDLNELCFDLDLSGFTGIDSEDFETGKSRGDEPSKYKEDHGDETPRSKGDDWSFEKETRLKETKSNQAGGIDCYCDASTNAVDPRIEDMQEILICKDAKLNALRNSMAVMENDVCEPYCIYAHIYTALEKIFGILCQNDKYKLYLDLMTSGKNTRCLDIKGKILFKLKVLEKFNIALIAPCSQDFASHNAHNSHNSEQECSCYRVEAAFALTSAESQPPRLDNKRAQLVADIMENEEMKDILNKENAVIKTDVDTDDEVILESYNINQENLKRIKNLQESYDELMTCYEALKDEKDLLLIRCRKYEELEKEFERLQNQLREYNALWNEKEHFRKRSLDLDALKEQYLVLCDETTNLETELKAESEINDVKTRTIEDLRNENLALEKRLTDATIAFEKEKNCARCKLNESECTIMCQGQQIKSLSLQIDKLLEQGPAESQSKQSETPTINLINEINSLKEQLKNLNDALFGSEEEKQQLQEEYQNKLNQINDLRIEVEDWKSNYQQVLQRNDYLEKYTDSFRDEVNKLLENNKELSEDVIKKTNAIDNLMHVINNKSEEVQKLMEDVELKHEENSKLLNEICRLRDVYKDNITALDTEKLQAIKSLQLAKQESHEILEKMKDYAEIVQNRDNLSQAYNEQSEKYNKVKTSLLAAQQENENLLQEIQRLQNINHDATDHILLLKDEKKQYKLSLELTKKDSKILEHKLQSYEDLSNQLQKLKASHEALIEDKNRLENELASKTMELNKTFDVVELTKKESEELQERLHSSQNLIADLENIEDAYKDLLKEQHRLKSELDIKKRGCDDLLDSYNNLREKHDQTCQKVDVLTKELECLKISYESLLSEKEVLQNDFDIKNEEINNIYNNLEKKIEENRDLLDQIKSLEYNHKDVQDSMDTLQKEHFTTKKTLNSLRKESDELINRVKYYENLQSQYDKLKIEHDEVKQEKAELENNLDIQLEELRKIQDENHALHSESQNLLSHSEDLERALINARTQLIASTTSLENPQLDIIKEIESMREEKLSKHREIRNLLNNIEELENIISNLSEDILARDDKIAILENHINQLQDEVKRLHCSLAEIIDTGEQIKENSYQKIRESLNTMEAHHSKATHNMKMELAKLQNDNIALQERLSGSKIKSEDTSREKYKYLSQISHLQNEREIIVTDIKQLELNSVGDSALSPDNCNVEEILRSLDRIRRYLEARSSKSTSLEQTLLKVQNSYQVVQNKADEAKKIVEKEKQKILNEKEEAIRDRQNMEKQLADLKYQLEKQVSQDKIIITDLEAEILNQQLIFDKLNQSTQSYISKLKEEMQTLKELYKTSLENIADLENQINLTAGERISHLNIIQDINTTLHEKTQEIEKLTNDLEILKNKVNKNQSIQASAINNIDKETQTNDEITYSDIDSYYDSKKIGSKGIDENDKFILSYAENTVTRETNIPRREKIKQGTEVQVLTASIDPEFDYFRNRYLNYKLKHLSFGPLNNDSFSGIRDNDVELDNQDLIMLNSINANNYPTLNQTTEDINVIDIYNKQSIHTNSSKNINSNYLYNEKDIKFPDRTSAITDLGLTTDNFNTKSSTFKASNMLESVSGLSTDKDLFVIYRESETNQPNGSNENKSLPTSSHTKDIIKAFIRPEKDNLKQTKKESLRKKYKKYATENDPSLYTEDQELSEDDSVKHKINISIPRVETNVSTIENISDGDKKSIDSYTINIYPVSKSTFSSDNKMESDYKIKRNNVKTSEHPVPDNAAQYFRLEHFDKVNTTKYAPKSVERDNYYSPSRSTHIVELSNEDMPNTNFDQIQFQDESRHTLSRTEADLRLIKTKGTGPSDSGEKKDSDKDFGLNYILATAQMDPDNIKMYNAINSLRKTRSDEIYGVAKLQEMSDNSPSINQSFSIDTKTYTEKGINTTLKLDSIDDCETRLKNLTNHLENVEKHYRKKIEAIKMQYDSNIKNILNEHNEGVKSIQGLHEETLHDIIKHHENEVENLRSMSIEAMRKADKLEKECRSLKSKLPVCSSTCLNKEFVEKSTSESRKHRKSRFDSKTLTKTNVEYFNVRPKSRSNGPCTCSLDINVSDTIRNIFEQVDVDQRKKAESTYLRYIANKMLHDTVEGLDCQELSFLHLKVCRVWKVKLTKEETLQKRIDSLEAELMTKHWDTQKDTVVALDRKVAEERRRLQEVREAVCRNVPTASKYSSSEAEPSYIPSVSPPTPDKDFLCSCNAAIRNVDVGERQSAGDLAPAALPVTSNLKAKRTKPETNRALGKLDAEERRDRRKKDEDDKKLYTDEMPTRLRRPTVRTNRK